MKPECLLILFSLIAAFPLFAEDLVELKNVDGRSIQVVIDDYVPEDQEVSVRVNGQGSRTRFSTTMLNEASKKRVEAWHVARIVDRYLQFDIDRIPGRADGTCYYEIEIYNPSSTEVKGLRAEYVIPMKLRSQVAKNQPKASASRKKGKKNKQQKIQYDTVEERVIKSGKINIPTISPRSRVVVESDALVIESKQEPVQGKGKGKAKKKQGSGQTKNLVNRHSVNGVLLKIYSGKKLIRTIESKHGISQLIQNYK